MDRFNPAAREIRLQDSTLRVFLADDQCVVREGLRALIDSQADLRVVGEGGDSPPAQESVGAFPPDVVVLDISLDGGSGSLVTERIKREWPDAKVLALALHEDRSCLKELLQAGARGYVLKRAAAEELLRAIRTVASGAIYITPALRDALPELLGRTPVRAQDSPQSLSQRESEVMKRLAQGYTNKEIACQLSIGVKTVETHKMRAMAKLGLDSRVDLVRYALAHRWLSPE